MKTKLVSIKSIYLFILLSLAMSILGLIVKREDFYLASVLFFTGLGFLSIGIFLSILMVISLIRRVGSQQSSFSTSPLSRNENRRIYIPLILQMKIALVLTLTMLFTSGLTFAYFVFILHVTSINLTDILISSLLNFFLGLMAATLILPRIGLFKEVKPGEVKIVEDPNFSGGITVGVLTLSRRSPSKEIVFIGTDNPEPVVSTVRAHELGHATEYHPIFLEPAVIFLFSLIVSSIWLLGYGYGYIYIFNTSSINIPTSLTAKVILIILSDAILTLLLIRVSESRADAFTFRIIGESAYTNLVEAIRRTYGREDIQSAKQAPLWSRITHTSSRNAMKTGDPLSSLGLWEFPVSLSFVASTIFITTYHSVNEILLLFPLLYIGVLVVSTLLGLVFLPVIRKYYKGTRKGSMNFSFLLAGLYMVISVGMLREYPNIYLIVLLFSVGMILISAIARAFLKPRDTIKVVAMTLLIYVSISALVSIIRIGV